MQLHADAERSLYPGTGGSDVPPGHRSFVSGKSVGPRESHLGLHGVFFSENIGQTEECPGQTATCRVVSSRRLVIAALKRGKRIT